MAMSQIKMGSRYKVFRPENFRQKIFNFRQFSAGNRISSGCPSLEPAENIILSLELAENIYFRLEPAENIILSLELAKNIYFSLEPAEKIYVRSGTCREHLF